VLKTSNVISSGSHHTYFTIICTLVLDSCLTTRWWSKKVHCWFIKQYKYSLMYRYWTYNGSAFTLFPTRSLLLIICSPVNILLTLRELDHQETNFYICYDTFYIISSLYRFPQQTSSVVQYMYIIFITTRVVPKLMPPIYFYGYKEHNNTIW